ncbi:MAG TPA: polyprenyl synthetase family protein [Myxococcota bacterium]
MTPQPHLPVRNVTTSSRLAQLSLDDVEAVMRRHSGAADDGCADYLAGLVCDHLETGGKRIRARLALAAASALGVSTTTATPWAAAVELLHNATLVHDDLQDGDRTRRGRPTTWAVHGMAQAINCGDLMLMLPTLLAAEVPASEAVRFRLSTSLARRAAATVRGQAADLNLRSTVDHGDPVDAYIRCIEGKTGELFALPVEGAALIAGHDVDTARALAEPFFVLGQLFQLQDDVLDLFGDKGRDARGADVREGKVSALVVEHLRLHPADRAWLLNILDTPRDDTADVDVAAVIDRFERGGALTAVLRRIGALATRAHQAPAHAERPELQALVVELIGLVLKPIQALYATIVVDDTSGTFPCSFSARVDA